MREDHQASDGTMAPVEGLRILHVKAGYVLALLSG